MFDPDSMRKRFSELGAKREAILAECTGIEAQRDKLIADHAAAVKPLEARLKAIKAPLYDLDQERAVIARALKGKVG